VLGPSLIVESQAKTGVAVNSIDKYDLTNNKYTKVVRIKDGLITKEEMDEAMMMARSRKGDTYDFYLIF